MNTTMTEKFVKAWVARNVHPIPGLSEAFDLQHEVARLRAKIIADGSSSGFSADALEAAMGDYDDYLTNAYEQVHDPELGFREV